MTNRKVLVLKGSPRLNGNSAALADQAATGARDAGAQVEVFDLHNMDIRPCDACDMCHEQNGICVIKDDMQTLYPKLRQADDVAIASPIYWFTISAQVKLCIDRWYALETSAGNALAGKQFGVLLAYGDSDPYTSGAINAIRTFQDMLRYIRADIAGFVYGTAMDVGDVQKQPDLMQRAYELGKRLAAGCGAQKIQMSVRQVFTSYDREGHQATGDFEYCPFCQAQLVVRESNDKPRRTCLGCGFVQFKNPAPVVSILILDGDKVLLGKRTGPPGEGKWALPSGYIEFEDDFLATGIREVKEETGLDVAIQSIINVVSSFTSPRFHFLTIYLLAQVVGGKLAAADDLAAVDWFSLSGPLPEMAFEEDSEMLTWYATFTPAGIPVDPTFRETIQKTL